MNLKNNLPNTNDIKNTGDNQVNSINSNNLNSVKKGSDFKPTSSIVYPKKNENGNTKYIKALAIIFGVLAVLALIWFVILPKATGNKISPFGNGDGLNLNTSTEVVNILTGEKYSEKDASSWKDIRPIGFMINNATPARPQSGLIDADLVYEVVAEGGITRFLAFFLTNSPEKVGPIRSAREYYLVLVKELSDAMIMHWGFSPQAQVAIDTWPVRSLFRGGAGNDTYCNGCTWRDTSLDVAVEHTLYASAPKLRTRATELGWEGKGDITPWKFKDDTTTYSSMPSASEVTVDFWYSGDYSAIFKYKADTNTYLRFNGYDENDQPLAHTDRESGKQIEIKNLVVQFVAESAIDGDDKNRLDYELIGSGNALVFVDGKVVNATWSKSERDSRTMFYDTNGNEIQFNRGKFWICIVPDRNVDLVVY